MSNNPNRWMSAFFLLAMFSIVAFAGTRAGVQASSNVLVTNPTSQPANVKQVGALQTYILGHPGVRIYNPDYAPVPTRDNDEPGRNAYDYYENMYFQPGVDSMHVTIAPPPAGKRLILTHISGNCNGADPVTQVTISLQGKAFTTYSTRAFPINAQPVGSLESGSIDAFLKVDPTDNLEIYASRFSAAGTQSFYLNLEGYYVSMP
jgi:hypothetical protein